MQISGETLTIVGTLIALVAGGIGWLTRVFANLMKQSDRTMAMLTANIQALEAVTQMLKEVADKTGQEHQSLEIRLERLEVLVRELKKDFERHPR